jgi:hypothetical protein
MHAAKYLHNILDKSIHKKQKQVLVEVTLGVVRSKQLKLSDLGRSLGLAIQARSGIRKVDRILGNKFFQKKNEKIYQAIIEKVLGKKARPIILVDWTKLPNVSEYALRASLPVEGRAITLYEEVHPQEKVGNGKVQRNYLKKLKGLLNKECCPILVTDAGFKNPWFKEVQSLGWDYIGRVRGKTKYKDKLDYEYIEQLYGKAGLEPEYLGEKILSKRNPLKTSFYIVKQKLKGRKSYRRDGRIKRDKDSKNYSRSQREPWLLVSSLKGYFKAKKVVWIYKKRMSIEESFRDTKSNQYGLSLERNKTYKRKRLIVWLMMGALANLLAMVVGIEAERIKLHYQFQSNSIKHRRVLSVFYLGCEVIKKKIDIPIKTSEIALVLQGSFL